MASISKILLTTYPIPSHTVKMCIRDRPEDYPYLNYEMNKKEISRLVEDVCNRYELSSVPPILDGLKDAGFHYATRAGVTVSVYDATVPPNKACLLYTSRCV